jgi:hypothetical protein
MRLEQRRYAEAEAPVREALDRQEKRILDTWERYDSESMLGASLAGQGKYGDAEPPLLSGFQGLSTREATIPAPNRVVLEQAVERIVQLYEAWGKPELAADWRNRLRRP